MRANATDAWLLFPLACVLVAVAYWPGLAGPLLLDDFHNLVAVTRWLEGQYSITKVIFGNDSGPLGRPLSMASFVLNAWISGNSIWPVKFTNLLIHLGTGLGFFLLLRSLLPIDPKLRRYQAWMPIAIAAVWLALPIFVSSVLYVVQRMAMLSAFFSALALWQYVVGRKALAAGKTRSGVLRLWLAVPLLMLLAILSKENGAIVPLLTLAVEICYFRNSDQTRRPKSVYAFYFVFLILPALAFLAMLFAIPERVIGDYATREFTMEERLLTQPRVLWSYVSAMLVPYGPRLGIFHDTYSLSRSLTHPWTTIAAIAGWIAVATVASIIRKTHPAILCGVLLFLFGHAIESTIIALEIYFEHRNYLPGIGILLASAGCIAAITGSMRTKTKAFRITGTALLCAIPLCYLWATHARALVWSSMDTILAQEIQHNPGSFRVRTLLAGVESKRGNVEGALAHMNIARAASSARQAMTYSIYNFVIYCATTAPPSESFYIDLESNTDATIETFSMIAAEMLANHVVAGECLEVDIPRVAGILTDWLDNTPTSPETREFWRTEYQLARITAELGKIEEATGLVEKAWPLSGYDPAIGVFAFQLNAALGRIDRCKSIIARLESLTEKGDHRLDEAVRIFRTALSDGSIVHP